MRSDRPRVVNYCGRETEALDTQLSSVRCAMAPAPEITIEVAGQGPRTYMVVHNGSRAQRRAGLAVLKRWEASGIMPAEIGYILAARLATISPEEIRDGR